MKKKVLVVLAAILVVAFNVYAGAGDVFIEQRLGVGTTDPGSSKLYVNSNSPGAHDTVTFADTLHDNTVSLLKLVGDSDSDAGGPFYTVFQANGNVAIGTTDAGSSKLYVNSNSPGAHDTVTFADTLHDNTVSLLKLVGDSDSNAGGPFYTVFQATGNVAIGATDSQGRRLFVKSSVPDIARFRGGSAYLDITNTGSGIRLSTDGTGSLGIRTAASSGGDQVTINASGLSVAGNIYATGTVTWSDEKFKENISPIRSPLNKILSIKGVSYKWKTAEYKDKGFTEGRHFGVIAQDIEKVLPEIVVGSFDGNKGVAYTEMIPVLIEAVKEQQKIIEELKSKVQRLEAKGYIAQVQ